MPRARGRHTASVEQPDGHSDTQNPTSDIEPVTGGTRILPRGIWRSTAALSRLAPTHAGSENRLRDYKWLIEQEVDSWTQWVSIPLRRRLWLLRHGFTSPCGKLYDFDDNGQEAYLSELQRYRLFRATNGEHRYLLDDKLSQHWMLADHPENRPTAFGVIDRGFVHGVAGGDLEGDPIPVSDWLPDAVRTQEKLVLKQLRGSGGKEVLVCAYDEGYTLDGEPVTERTLCEAAKQLSGYLVTEHVTQHAYADSLYPHATNTMRLLTIWDEQAGELLTPVAVHRIGTDRSRPVDNLSVGGLSAEIDFETGELSRAAQLPFSGEVPWYSAHPDTGAPIEGERVPKWETVRSTVEQFAMETTNIPIIGWDILVDESGVPVVIEANTGTDVQLLQVHQPLLDDPRVAEVLSRYLPEIEGQPDRAVP